jgi:tetratricopeptide (TPR) repeat protein
MRSFIFALCLSPFFLSACNSGSEQKGFTDSLSKPKKDRNVSMGIINKAETAMRDSKTFESRLALDALKAYADFANNFPEDSLAAEYLFRAADIAQGMGNYLQAANYFEIILNKHKNYKRYADACFVAAHNYDEHLEKINDGASRAKVLYEYIINNYPNTPYAEQAKVLVTYIGKSNEQLLDDIIKKNESAGKKN